jgi:hypothetical protein
LYSCSWGDTVNFRNCEVGTRYNRGMTVFVLKVNFLTYLSYVNYYMKQMQADVLNSGTTFSFPHPFQLVITETAVWGTT